MARLDEISVADILGEEPGSSNDVKGTRSFVLSYLRQNPEGVNVQMVSKFANISETRARQILGELVAQRELFTRKLAGMRDHIYYPNGKLIHKYLQDSRDFGDQVFRLSFHEGRRTPLLQIQERRFTLMDGEKVEGSIFVELGYVRQVIQFLEDMLTKFDQFEETKRLKEK